VTGRRTTRRREGFTLPELMIGMVLTGIVMATLITVIVRQQRFYRSATEVIDTRSQTRQAINLLPNDLRMLSSALGDIREMRDSSVDINATVGTGVACRIGLASITLPPMDAVNGPFTSWTSPPRVGDAAHVFIDTLGTFRTHEITAVDSNTVQCPGAPFLDPALDAGKWRYQLVLTPAPNATDQVVGAPVRITRRVRYSLYQSPVDRQWYLGYRDQTAAVTGLNPVLNAIQPVSGPYRPYATDATSGLRFFYFTATGAQTAVPAQVARIDVAVRAKTLGQIQIAGMRTESDKRRAHTDSLSIALRNRW
jgi:prepilin-type N-terminal cleavage/methylation domain-containing protein